MLDIKSTNQIKKKILIISNKIFILSLFAFLPLQFFCRYFDFFEIQNFFRLYIILFISYIFVTSKNMLSIFLSCMILFFLFINYLKLKENYLAYTLAGIIAYSSFMIFSINKKQILDIIKNENFILTISTLCCLLLIISGSLATFYWNDVQRLTHPRLFEDYPLTNPNTVALFIVFCLNLILMLLTKTNQTLSNNNILFLYIFSFLTFYVLVLTLSRQSCIIIIIIKAMYLIDAYMKKNNFNLKLFFSCTFILSLIVAIYVFDTRGDFVQQQYSGRISSLMSYGYSNFNTSILNESSILNKYEIFNIFIGKVFGASTNSILYINNLIQSNNFIYLPSGDSVFLASVNNGGILLTTIIIYLFITAILPDKINYLSTTKMLGNIFILNILSFGHVFNENYVVFIIFFISLFISKNINN